MDWSTVGPAVLAGGIFGSIITVLVNILNVFITNKLTKNREKGTWVLSERHKVAVEIIDTLSMKVKEGDLEDWTYKLRNSSLKFQLLYESGDAPSPLRETLEEVFKLIQAKKDGSQSEDWAEELKESTKKLRRELAKSL